MFKELIKNTQKNIMSFFFSIPLNKLYVYGNYIAKMISENGTI